MKRWRVFLKRQAEEDANDIWHIIVKDNHHAAEAFLDAIEEASNLLSATPEIGSPRYFFHPELQGLRFLPNQETAEYLERCLGRTSEYAHSQTVRDGTKTSQGLSEQGVPLLTAGEIKMMMDEDIIGFHRRLPPFQAKRMDWRRFQTLAQKRSIPLLNYTHYLTLNKDTGISTPSPAYSLIHHPLRSPAAVN